MTGERPRPTQRAYAVLYIATFLDLSAVSMITMQLSNHLREMGASHTTIGYISSVYGFVQMFSCPVMGGYADSHGKRYMLLICIITCLPAYISLGWTGSLLMFAALRFYIGIFKHQLNLLQSSLSDSAGGDNDKNKSKQAEVLGYYQSASSLAFIVSPPIGGYLMQTDNGYLKIALCVGILYALNAVLVYTFMPADAPASPFKQTTKSREKKSNSDPWWSFLTLRDVDQTCLILILVSRFLGGFSGHLWRSTYSLLYKEVHHLSPSQIGWLISFNAFVQTFIGFTMKYVSKILPSSLHQFITSCVMHSIAMVMIANITNNNLLYLVILPMSTATMISKISSQNYTYEVLGRKHTAYIIGLTTSIMSGARLVTPIISGYMMEHSLTWTLYLAAVSTLLSGLFYIIVFYRKKMFESIKVKAE